MAERLPTTTARQLMRLLEKAGVVVPLHSRDLGRGLTLRIIKDAGISREEFLRLTK